MIYNLTNKWYNIQKDKFMVECETVIDINVQKKLTKKTYISSIIALIIGSIGLVAYLVLGSLINEIWTEIFLIFAFPFAFGLIYIITLKKNYKVLSGKVMVNCYVFDETNFTVTTIQNDNNLGSSQISYTEIYKCKEINDYIFIYLNKVSAFPIDKRRLKDNQLLELKNLLKIN